MSQHRCERCNKCHSKSKNNQCVKVCYDMPICYDQPIRYIPIPPQTPIPPIPTLPPIIFGTASTLLTAPATNVPQGSTIPFTQFFGNGTTFTSPNINIPTSGAYEISLFVESTTTTITVQVLNNGSVVRTFSSNTGGGAGVGSQIISATWNSQLTAGTVSVINASVNPFGNMVLNVGPGGTGNETVAMLSVTYLGI